MGTCRHLRGSPEANARGATTQRGGRNSCNSGAWVADHWETERPAMSGRDAKSQEWAMARVGSARCMLDARPIPRGPGYVLRVHTMSGHGDALGSRPQPTSGRMVLPDAGLVVHRDGE